MPELYAGQLEEDGASEVGYKTEKIDSGLKIYEFTGIFEATGIKSVSYTHLDVYKRQVCEVCIPCKID